MSDVVDGRKEFAVRMYDQGGTLYFYISDKMNRYLWKDGHVEIGGRGTGFATNHDEDSGWWSDKKEAELFLSTWRGF